MGNWPWPNDTRIDKLKRIVDSYRTALMEVDPGNCRLIDARMCEYGESWVCNGAVMNVNENKTVNEIHTQFGPGFAPWNIHNWARDYPDRLPKRGTRDGKTLYRVGDVLALQVSLRV